MIASHKKQREFLENKIKSNQLSHAYLFSGAKDIGKKEFALELAELVGCKFPDLLIIESINSTSSIKNKKDNLEIDIDQIRNTQNFLSYKPYNNGFKIVIVDNAERMNVEAQSCFLKTLEEPKGQTLLILISSKPDMLLPTIISRCQQVKFFKQNNLPVNSKKLEKEEGILKDLMPIINSSLADKFKYVKSIDFEKQDSLEIIEVMQKYFRKQLLNNFSDKKTKKFLELSEEISKKLFFTNASPKLALEILLMEL
ncbi:MAG: AAA family ATPase [Candidatus Staskawiczbacteria bacterium]|nr:AAA family ATPase [Candidatus Staskawiczbacteria bacterium]